MSISVCDDPPVLLFPALKSPLVKEIEAAWQWKVISTKKCCPLIPLLSAVAVAGMGLLRWLWV